MSSQTLPAHHNAAAAPWFWALWAMIFVMAVVGAITRLTESGLSIMEWAPWTGALPPMTLAQWERLFALYRETDEYRLQWQANMTLSDFQGIFWWEWIHRLWGRLIGLVALGGLVWSLFAAARKSVGWIIPLHFLLVGLGTAAQGALGWFMVHSGFQEGLTDVASIRLALHLSAALLLLTYVLTLALGTQLGWRAKHREQLSGGKRALMQIGAVVLVTLLGLTIVTGAFVAGNNAGVGYNSFPLMNGELVPTAYDSGLPAWQNWTENNAAVQVNHRLMATLTMSFAVLLTLSFLAMIRRQAPRIRRAVHSVGGWTLVQYGLGIGTILMSARGVPVSMGALHQAGALVLLSLTVWLCYALYSARSD